MIMKTKYYQPKCDHICRAHKKNDQFSSLSLLPQLLLLADDFTKKKLIIYIDNPPLEFECGVCMGDMNAQN